MVDPTANTISHEAGHGFGLEHQSTINEMRWVVEEYNRGTPEWTPIMGNNLTTDRATWHRGFNVDRAWQDDMAILGNVLGYRADDHSDTMNNATILPTGLVGAGRSGIIGGMNDVDWFKFSTGGGKVAVNLAVIAPGANLDAKIELLRDAGNGNLQSITSANRPDSLGANIFRELSAGTYYVRVFSNGRYGDVGQYTLSIGVPAALRGFNNQFLRANYAGSGDVTLNTQWITGSEILHVVYIGADLDGRERVAFQTWSGQFLRVNADGRLDALGQVIDDTTSFSMIRLGGDQFAFMASNGLFLRADNGGGGAVLANSPWIGGWETFRMVLV